MIVGRIHCADIVSRVLLSIRSDRHALVMVQPQRTIKTEGELMGHVRDTSTVINTGHY